MNSFVPKLTLGPQVIRHNRSSCSEKCIRRKRDALLVVMVSFVMTKQECLRDDSSRLSSQFDEQNYFFLRVIRLMNFSNVG